MKTEGVYSARAFILEDRLTSLCFFLRRHDRFVHSSEGKRVKFKSKNGPERGDASDVLKQNSCTVENEQSKYSSQER